MSSNTADFERIAPAVSDAPSTVTSFAACAVHLEGARRPTLRALDALRAAVGGRVMVPADPAYAAAHLVWNRARQQRPAVIVECATTEDVVVALGFARTERLPVAIRGGGYTPSEAA